MASMSKFLSDIREGITKNSPTILAVIGGVGVIGSVVLASKAAVKTKEDIAKAQEEAEEDLEFKEKAKIYAKNYWPTAAMVVATEVCIYGSNHINKQRFAALASAYILKETDFKEYKEHVEETIGHKKAQEIKDSLIQKHIKHTEQNESNTAEPIMPRGTKLDLWWDETSKRYFYSNVDYVRRAEIEANAMLQKNGFVGVNDIYEILGLETIPLMDNDGWDKETHGEVVLTIGSAVKDPDTIVWTMTMNAEPSSEWLGIG